MLKANATSLAVAAWKRTRRQPQKTARKPKRRLSSSDRHSVVSSLSSLQPATPEDSPLPRQRLRPRQIIDTSSPNGEELVDRVNRSTKEREAPLLPLFDQRPAQSISVQISPPHSSLDREQYILYLASISQQTAQSSHDRQPESDLGKSSPTPSGRRVAGSRDYNTIIPDSQSLPGSSTYNPSTTYSTDAGLTQIDTQNLSSNLLTQESAPEDLVRKSYVIDSSDCIDDTALSTVRSGKESLQFRAGKQSSARASFSTAEPPDLPAGQYQPFNKSSGCLNSILEAEVLQDVHVTSLSDFPGTTDKQTTSERRYKSEVAFDPKSLAKNNSIRASSYPQFSPLETQLLTQSQAFQTQVPVESLRQETAEPLPDPYIVGKSLRITSLVCAILTEADRLVPR